MAAEQIDEIALLGCDLGGDSSYIGEINEDELLGLNESASQEKSENDASSATTPIVSQSNRNEDTEQLDYEEEEEGNVEKPGDKFGSETKSLSSSSNTNQKTGATKCYINPKFQNKLPGSQESLPSLLSQSVAPPMQQMMGLPPVDIGVRMVMMNSLRPIFNSQMRPMGPPPPFMCPGFQQNFPPSGMPPMMQMPNRIPGPITAQIGQLSTVIHQQDDGTITFRTTIPQNQPRVTVARAGCSEQEGSNQNKDWASMVDDFLKAPSKPRKRDRRSRSGSSRSSRSYSSYSGSYSDDSYSGSGSSRSKSPSPRRKRRHSPRRKHGRPSYHRSRRHRRDRFPRRHRSSPKSELKNGMECAEAIGVDQEYMRKLEEQKRLREEVARQKYQKDSQHDQHGQRSSHRQRRSDEDRHSSKSSTTSTQIGSSNIKPYLVVVVSNLSNLTDAYKRLKMIAQAVGPTKKVWQTSDDSVSIIFENHEHAKSFMLQYHMKQFNGITLNIGLEKIFLNLASIP